MITHLVFKQVQHETQATQLYGCELHLYDSTPAHKLISHSLVSTPPPRKKNQFPIMHVLHVCGLFYRRGRQSGVGGVLLSEGSTSSHKAT